MDMKLEFTGEIFEDRGLFQTIQKAFDYKSALMDIEQMIKYHIKHHEVPPIEEKLLEDIQEEIYNILRD